MAKKFQLQIPEPCQENWDKMIPVDKGRFCDSCQKAVVDFTGMSDAQLIAYFKKPSTGSVCGRFYNDQLDRDFEIPRKRIPWLKYFFQFTIPVLLTGIKAQAQGDIRIKEKITADTLVNCIKPVDDNLVVIAGGVGPLRGLDGRVVDEKGNGIPYATIYLKDTKEGTVCDSAGYFTLDVSAYQKTIRLTASCVGYLSNEKQVKLRKGNPVEIKLATNIGWNGEVVVTAYGSVRKGGVMGGLTVKRSYLQRVKEYFIKDSCTVFPNPAKTGDEIKIEWKKADAGDHSIELYNLQGQLIQSAPTKIENETMMINFRLPLISPGTYILRITNKKTGKKHVEKIIIR